MPFNENQFFYAALYLAECLPGGEAFTDDICKKYGKPYIPMNAPKAEFDEGRFDPLPSENPEKDLEDFLAGGPLNMRLPEAAMRNVQHLIDGGVDRVECECFFLSAYESLKKGETETRQARGGEYIQLEIDDDPEYLARAYPPLAAGLAAAGVPSQAVHKHAIAYLHDNGQLFIYAGKSFLDVNYPGKPALDCPYVSDFSTQDLAHCPKMRWETFYRMVKLSPGQEYTIKKRGGDGRETTDVRIAKQPSLVVIAHYDTEVPLTELSDEEILGGGPRIRESFHCRGDEFEPGGIFFHPEHGEKLDEISPGVFRHLTKPMHCMAVTEKMQFGIGSRYMTAMPGDIIIGESEPRVLQRKYIESGGIRLIPEHVSKPGGPSAPKRAN